MTDGKTLYQQFPCVEPHNFQTRLPIFDTKPQYNNIGKNVRRKQLKSNNPRKNNSQKKTITSKNKAKQRQQRKRKATQLQKVKANRHLQRCNDVNIKIKLLQNRLRLGYTAKQEVRLKEQLIHYTNLQYKYCD
jgi:hypothetical protein